MAIMAIQAITFVSENIGDKIKCVLIFLRK